MEAMFDLLLDVCNYLYAATACTKYSNFLPLEGIPFFVSRRVQELAPEIVQARDVWPFPVVEHATSIDEELGRIMDYLACLKVFYS